MGGGGGGLCVVRGKRVLFVDSAAGSAEQLGLVAEQLSQVEGIEDVFVLPAVRDLLDRYGGRPK